MPSDYRYDPFNNIAEPVDITGETHIIPSNSPYTIRLREVPVKESPSTVSMTIAGVAATEVAADPAASEFRCDYTTSADSDDAWNTGLIQFNAADAGKVVIVAYKGMGTLASINADRYPSWWLDRGDGSDGEFSPTADCTISGIKNYTNIYIPAGITVTVSKYVKIKCQGACVIDGTLTAKGQGALGGTGYDIDTLRGNSGSSGYRGGVGGVGGRPKSASGDSLRGSGGVSYYLYPYLVATADMLAESAYLDDIHLGSGGGASANAGYAGGNGGGSIAIVAKSIKINGVVTCDGAPGTNGTTRDAPGGGGGGGGLKLIADVIIILGTATANGGPSGTITGTNTYIGADGSAGVFFMKELGVA